MAIEDEVSSILDRITRHQHTEADIISLRQLLKNVNNDRDLVQLGKNIVNIGQVRGGEFQIGDRIYQGADAETIKETLRTILQESQFSVGHQEASGIYQNTQSGDAAARDINKGNSYEKCTILQFIVPSSNFSNSSQKLLKVFDSPGIPLQSIQKAYQDSLPPYAHDWGLKENDINPIKPIKKIEVLEEFRKLLHFVCLLSQDENVHKEIRNQLSMIAEELAQKKHPCENKNKLSTDCFSKQERQFESYLIITLEPYNDNEQFLLNAWLIIDDSVPVNDLSKFISLLDKDEQQQGILCKFNDIQERLDQFIEKSLNLLKFKPHTLTIELFLPNELLYTNVEWWNISDFDYEEIPIGIMYPIRLRSIERLQNRYLIYHWEQWRNNWNRVKTVLNDIPIKEQFGHLDLIKAEIFTLQSLLYDLDEKIGLKITCYTPENKRNDLLKAILKAAIPIVFWTRCDLSNQDDKEKIDKLFNRQPLGQLCDSLKIKRKEAYRQKTKDEKEKHLGFHLALLWEDPYHLTPNVMLELKTTGQ